MSSEDDSSGLDDSRGVSFSANLGSNNTYQDVSMGNFCFGKIKGVAVQHGNGTNVWNFGSQGNSVRVNGAKSYTVNGKKIDSDSIEMRLEVKHTDGTREFVPFTKDVVVQVHEPCNALNVNSTSANVTIHCESKEPCNVTAGSTSGDIAIECPNAGHVTCTTTSGDIIAKTARIEHAQTMSGDIIGQSVHKKHK